MSRHAMPSTLSHFARRPVFVVPCLVLLGACGPAPIPHIHVGIHADEVVRDSSVAFDISITLTNNGPGRAIVQDACPWFSVLDVNGVGIGPGGYCLAVTFPTAVLEPGQVRTIDAHWDGEYRAGGAVRSGTYRIRPNLIIATPDRVWVPIDTPTVQIEIVEER